MISITAFLPVLMSYTIKRSEFVLSSLIKFVYGVMAFEVTLA